MNVACILVGGPDRVIEVNGERIRFEDHGYMGPIPLTTRGQERRLGSRHPFWDAVTRWYRQGKQLAPDGRCLWGERPEPSVPGRRVIGEPCEEMEAECLIGRHWQLVGPAKPSPMTADHPRRPLPRRPLAV